MPVTYGVAAAALALLVLAIVIFRRQRPEEKVFRTSILLLLEHRRLYYRDIERALAPWPISTPTPSISFPNYQKDAQEMGTSRRRDLIEYALRWLVKHGYATESATSVYEITDRGRNQLQTEAETPRAFALKAICPVLQTDDADRLTA